MRKNLEMISDTWADLWALLNLTRARVTHLIHCQYKDIQGKTIALPTHSMFRDKHHALNPTALLIIRHRQQRYPGDIFLFQSHCSRVKATAKPVTVIVFNTALKKAALGSHTKNRQ